MVKIINLKTQTTDEIFRRGCIGGFLRSVCTNRVFSVIHIEKTSGRGHLFEEVPEKNVLVQKSWFLRPNAVLMNTGYTNYRLYHLAGRLFLNYQAVPVVYAAVIIAVLFIGRWKYYRLQVWK